MSILMQEIENRIKELYAEYEDILSKLEPLEKRKIELKEKLDAFKKIVELEETKVNQDLKAIPRVPEEGMSAKEAYQHFIKKHLIDKSFRDDDIRNLLSEQGFLVNGKVIAASYSRSLLRVLTEEGFLRKVKRGLYRFRQESGPN